MRVSNVQSQGMKMSHSFRARENTKTLGVETFFGFFCPGLVISSLPATFRSSSATSGEDEKVRTLFGAVTFVVPAIGLSFMALERTRMKSMQEPKAPD